jgi:hypothetical protein
MITGYRDKRKKNFAAGVRERALEGIERPARLKLDRLDAATSLLTLLDCQATASRQCPVIARGNLAFASTIGGESVLSGQSVI